MVYEKLRIKILIVSLLFFVGAIAYMVYGLTSECGGFEGISCPRGFRCDLTETPGMVVIGDLDQCIINTDRFTK